MHKLTFYVPLDSAEKVKSALFAVGVGKIGNYDSCSFETRGVGQFRALSGANPTIGNVGVVEKVEELRVEMVMDDTIVKEAVMALKKAHPYETVAYDVIKCVEV
nr:NGG1p interacting factor NIF3 [Bacteriovorax sp. HI3]